ncbi:MAG: N-acetylglucosamine kinase [Candidatus Sulfotelmatobacter sp.]
MTYFLGIDGGGSKTTCVVGDESSSLAIAESGPSNMTRVGEAGARESLQQAISAACAAANISPRQVQRACIGIAGAGRKEIAEAVRNIVTDLIPGEIEVVGDMEIALAAAFGSGPGVVVIAGTGSIAYGRDAQGKTARAGGWGFAISDEGSAHWIGRLAVGALLREADETEESDSALFRQIKTAWAAHTLPELASTANGQPNFATLLPAVLAAAESGDAVAKNVLSQAAAELARLAAIVVRRLFPENSVKGDAVPVAMAGGVFRHSEIVRQLFLNSLHEQNVRVILRLAVVDPVEGALQMARDR